MSTETHVYFAVFDFDDPNVITTMMGIEPTKAWVKGERYEDLASRPGIRTHSRWSITSGLAHSEPLETQLDSLLGKLEPLKSQIHEIQRQYRAEINIAQYFYDYNPNFQLTPDVLQRLANLGLAVDFDQYYFGEGK